MMETLYLLIPISVVLVFLIGIAFWWSLRNGQFDDLEGPAYRILMDDDRSRPVSPAATLRTSHRTHRPSTPATDLQSRIEAALDSGQELLPELCDNFTQ
jgi:cbb3-type cytochrome oxidase maturation protein